MKKKITLKKYLKTNRFCPKCGKELSLEIHSTVGHYPFFCKKCDENFYDFETLHKHLN